MRGFSKHVLAYVTRIHILPALSLCEASKTVRNGNDGLLEGIDVEGTFFLRARLFLRLLLGGVCWNLRKNTSRHVDGSCRACLRHEYRGVVYIGSGPKKSSYQSKSMVYVTYGPYAFPGLYIIPGARPHNSVYTRAFMTCRGGSVAKALRCCARGRGF